MRVTSHISDIRQFKRERSGSIGLVPTMGALHAGHLSLVARARQENDHVVVSIYVNPTQFAADEDLDAYPRPLDKDLARLEAAGVDAVFTPSDKVMYPAGFQTSVTIHEVTQRLEGASRPDHFGGVAVIVTKLFNIVQPDRAYFGQKDAQQVVVIQRLVADLNIPLELVICPIVREPHGLAMSSRNQYLTPEQRESAGVIYRSLQLAAERIKSGERRTDEIRRAMQALIDTEPEGVIDYISIADAVTLQEKSLLSDGDQVLISLAVQFGVPRLLDNALITV